MQTSCKVRTAFTARTVSKSQQLGFGLRPLRAKPCRPGPSSLIGQQCRASASEEVEAGEASVKSFEEEFEDIDTPDEPGQFTHEQMVSFVQSICRDTDFVEIELENCGQQVRIKRSIAAEISQSPSMQSVDGNGAGVLPGPAIERPFQSTASMDESQFQQASQSNGHMSSTDEEDYEENLVLIGAPKVGILRRGRYAKGKRVGKGNLIEEGAKVKKGQQLAFIEQLGTYVAVEAPQAGEIASFVIEDGKAVEYKEVIVELAPFFGGHIIGDKKYA